MYLGHLTGDETEAHVESVGAIDQCQVCQWRHVSLVRCTLHQGTTRGGMELSIDQGHYMLVLAERDAQLHQRIAQIVLAFSIMGSPAEVSGMKGIS